jgi:hypothetical protein
MLPEGGVHGVRGDVHALRHLPVRRCLDPLPQLARADEHCVADESRQAVVGRAFWPGQQRREERRDLIAGVPRRPIDRRAPRGGRLHPGVRTLARPRSKVRLQEGMGGVVDAEVSSRSSQVYRIILEGVI